MTQIEKAQRFRLLHQRVGTFVVPNPWDGVTARLLAALGFEALATSSAAHAATLGRRDGCVTRDEALAHARLIVASVDLPVTGDFENGFGDAPATVAETIRLAAAAGLVGCSIEDATGNPASPLYEISFAAERIAAAVAAVRALPFPFTVTARAENFVRGRRDLEDTIARLQAYERAGADVVFAPGLPDLATVRRVCASVTKPVNVIGSTTGAGFTVEALAAVGVKRISLAASLHRAAMTGFLAAAREAREQGTFGYADRIVTIAGLNEFLPP